MSNWVKLTRVCEDETVWVNLDQVRYIIRYKNEEQTTIEFEEDEEIVKETPEEILRGQMLASSPAIPDLLDDWRPKCHPVDGNWTTNVQGTSLRPSCSVCGGSGL